MNVKKKITFGNTSLETRKREVLSKLLREIEEREKLHQLEKMRMVRNFQDKIEIAETQIVDIFSLEYKQQVLGADSIEDYKAKIKMQFQSEYNDIFEEERRSLYEEQRRKIQNEIAAQYPIQKMRAENEAKAKVAKEIEYKMKEELAVKLNHSLEQHAFQLQNTIVSEVENTKARELERAMQMSTERARGGALTKIAEYQEQIKSDVQKELTKRYQELSDSINRKLEREYPIIHEECYQDFQRSSIHTAKHLEEITARSEEEIKHSMIAKLKPQMLPEITNKIQGEIQNKFDTILSREKQSLQQEFNKYYSTVSTQLLGKLAEEYKKRILEQLNEKVEEIQAELQYQYIEQTAQLEKQILDEYEEWYEQQLHSLEEQRIVLIKKQSSQAQQWQHFDISQKKEVKELQGKELILMQKELEIRETVEKYIRRTTPNLSKISPVKSFSKPQTSQYKTNIEPELSVPKIPSTLLSRDEIVGGAINAINFEEITARIRHKETGNYYNLFFRKNIINN